MIAYSTVDGIIEAAFIVGILWFVICALPGRWFGRQRGRQHDGFVLGFLLGPVGWLFALLLPPSDEWVATDERRREIARCQARDDYEQRKAQRSSPAPTQRGDADADADAFARWRSSRP